MRYVAIDGGLGNQMFEYAFALCLKKKLGIGVKTILTSRLEEHVGGYELDRIFGIKMETPLWSYLYNCRLKFLFQHIFRLFHKTFWGENYNYQPEVFTTEKSFYYGTWQVAKYYEAFRVELLNLYAFPQSKLSIKTIELSAQMNNCNAVAVHIRRGDYQNARFANFLGCCTNVEYYNKAIRYITEHVIDPVFFFFSDDIQWVKDNIPVANAIYVNHNLGLESWQDMYLMSRCKYNITANSSFSWWGAWLNTNQNKIVISPKRWFANIENDDVTPDNWIRL